MASHKNVTLADVRRALPPTTHTPVRESIDAAISELEQAVADLHSDIEVLRDRCGPFTVPDRFNNAASGGKDVPAPKDRSSTRARLDQLVNSLHAARAKATELMEALDC